MKLFFILISVVLSNTSCVHVYYAPSNANIPLLSHKGEARVNGLYTTGWDSEFDGGELQLAYAVTNHFGVTANGFTAGKSEVVSDWEVMGDFGPSPGGQREKGHGSTLNWLVVIIKLFRRSLSWKLMVAMDSDALITTMALVRLHGIGSPRFLYNRLLDVKSEMWNLVLHRELV
jgi:hypothetical protein